MSVFWGANPVAIKIGLTAVPPLRLAVFRFLVGGVVIALWVCATGRLRSLRLGPGEWRPLVILGALFTAQIGAMNIGASLTSAAHTAIIQNLYAVHTVVLAHFMIPGDRLTPRRLAGVVVAYAGIVVLFWRQTASGSPTLLGDAIIFVSAFLLAERTVYLARTVQALDPAKILLGQSCLGVLAFLAISAAVEHGPTRWSPALFGSLAFQGIIVAGFNFLVNLWLLRRYRPSSLVPFFLTQPLFGVLAASLLLGDRLTSDLLLATAAVAAGIGITSSAREPAARPV